MNADRDAPVMTELLPGSDTLFLIFGGIAGALDGLPPFEFYRAARILQHSKIFLRDPAQAWYQRGLPGIGANVHAVKDFLHTEIQRSGATDIRFVGNSMGGFAALLFCAMIGLGRAVCFAPQTFIDRENRATYGDRRWAPRIAQVHDTSGPGDVLDLQAWLAANRPEVSAAIHISNGDKLDLAHAGRLSGFKNISCHTYDFGGHGLVRHLRDDGRLAGILLGRGVIAESEKPLDKT